MLQMEPILDDNIPEQREILRRLFRVKATETEMMAQRGYRLDSVIMLQQDRNFNPLPLDLSGLSNPSLRFETLLQSRRDSSLPKTLRDGGRFRSRIEFSSLYVGLNNPQDEVLILYLGSAPGKQVAKDDFDIVYKFIQTQKFRHMILISERGLNPENTNTITNRTIGYKIEVFKDQDLAFNITKHALAPISTVHIPVRQRDQFAQQEGIQPDKLPMIMNDDANCKYFGGLAGDCFMSRVMGATVDTSISYKITRQAPTVKK
jgi:DNA-directed RNA polymerase subunit H (RpoH/RPB5)